MRPHPVAHTLPSFPQGLDLWLLKYVTIKKSSHSFQGSSFQLYCFLMLERWLDFKSGCRSLNSKELVSVYHAFKCNLKDLTTKSALSAWGQLSLTGACPVAGYIDHVILWHVQFSFVLGSVRHFLPLPPPPRLCLFFSTDLFSMTGACSFHVTWRLMAELSCCVSQGGIISI